jgi:hypothetical protein
MATWLYGLILPRNAARVPGDVRGIGETPVRLLSCEGVSAVVGTIDYAVPRSDLAAVRAHDRVLRRIAERSVTVAAMRFGQFFPTDTQACADLATRVRDAAGTLERLDGMVEMRVLLPESEAPFTAQVAEEVGPGRAYLERVRRNQPVNGLSLRSAMGPLVHDERVEKLHMPGATGVAFAHLIDAQTVDRYRGAIGKLPDLANARVIGPLPLYSFADAEYG